MDFYNEYVLIEYIESALRKCDRVIKRGEKWQFRCNICGDSKISKTKRRAWILKSRKGIWIFNCFNQCGSMGVLAWLKKHFPDEYREYFKEILSRDMRKKKLDITSRNKEPEYIPPKKNKPKPSFNFKLIGSEKHKDVFLVKEAISFCEKRKIPSSIYTKFFVCDDGVYSGRLIIPFYNDSKKSIYYFQARLLVGNGEKYISMEGEKKIYNIHNVDKSKPIMATEGMFDSMFLENSIAIAGLRMSESTEAQLKDLDVYFLLDSDKDARKKSLELLKKEKWVFNWEKFVKEKKLPKRDKWDINEVILYIHKSDRFTFDDLKEFFTNDVLDSIYFM